MKSPSRFLMSCLAGFGLASASADQFGDFTYTDIGTSITITDYPDAATGAVVIPNTIVGKPVTAIGALAFLNCGEITSVSIPASVNSIGDQAFVNCVKITTVNLPAGITRIGYNTFAACFKLDGVTIPSSVTHIDDSAFISCKALTSIIIPPTVTTMGHSVFYDCNALTSITLSPNVTDIGQFQFYSCDSLTEITIPASVTNIGNSAFKLSFLLEEVNFKGNAPTLGTDAFNGNASGFHINFYNGKSGFTTPTWNGLTAVNVGDEPIPEISIKQPPGTDLTDGVSNRDFGSVVMGEEKAITFMIQNDGTGALGGIAVTLTGLHAADYQISETPSTTVPFLNSTMFQVTFTPTATGTRTAEILVASDDTDENPFNILISGIGTAVPVPEIEVRQPADSKLVDGTSKRSFGSAVAGKKGAAKSFTIRNTGSASLTGISVKSSGKNSGDFLIETKPGKSLPPGGKTTFKVRFKPSAKGTRNSVVQIKSNDADENPFDIKVAGEGTRK